MLASAVLVEQKFLHCRLVYLIAASRWCPALIGLVCGRRLCDLQGKELYLAEERKFLELWNWCLQFVGKPGGY